MKTSTASPESSSKEIHVLIVDDSALVRQIMQEILVQEPDISVTTAADPIIAQDKMRRRQPDVIVLDLQMPRMDGLTFLRKIMATNPVPVVICSGNTGAGTLAAVRALDEGAVEIITKPKIGVKEFLFESAVLLIDAIRGAAQSRLRQRVVSGSPVPGSAAGPPVRRHALCRVQTDMVIAIGASTGGTEAIREILMELPSDAPPILIVQHMPAVFTKAFADHLDAECAITVKEAKEGDDVVPGRVLIAPGNRHMSLRRLSGGYVVEIDDGPLVSRHRPSVNVLFSSVARAAGVNSIGIILTGMGDDGAEGLFEMKVAGARTIAQDEKSCVVFGMPKAAIDQGAIREVQSLRQIVFTLATMRTSAGNYSPTSKA